MQSALVKSKPLLLVLLTTLMLWFLFEALELKKHLSPTQFIDSYEYYAAYALVGEGKNPYDSSSISLKQKELGLVTKHPVMMWNPPWTFITIWPLVEQSFANYRIWLLIVNLLIPLASVLLFWGSLKKESLPPKLIIIGAYLFYPVFDCISYGQISLIVSFGTFLLLWGVSRERLVIVAVSIPFLLIKPHFTAIFLTTISVWLLLNSKIKVFFVILISSLITMGVSQAIWPGTYAQWIEVLLRPTSTDITQTPLGWHTASLTHLITSTFNLGRETLPLVMFGIGLLSSIIVFKIKHYKPWEIISFAAFIALIFSPFVWLFDMSLLLSTQILLTLMAIETRKIFIVFSLFLFQIAAVLISQSFSLAQHSFSWFLLAYLLLAVIVFVAIQYNSEERVY